MPSPRENPPVIQALIQASDTSHTPEEFRLRIEALGRRYAETIQNRDFEYCLLHWLRSGDVPSEEFRKVIARYLIEVIEGERTPGTKPPGL